MSSHKRSNPNGDTKVVKKICPIVTEQRKDLPIYLHKDEIVKSIQKYQTTILVGETGTGKSTQLPQYLADHFTQSGKCVVCTQPRRVAAVTIAQKVASEQGCNVGEEVGYSIRFEDKCSARTKIKFVTDGVLLRECMSDPQLSRYSVVILDEAHERSLQTDILMGLLRNLQEQRSDLRIVVMSATLQTELFANFFKGCNVLNVPGRQYPVDVFYTKVPEADYVDAAMLTCLQIHEDEEPGGVLVFLPGQDDIESLQQLLEDNLPSVTGKKDSSSLAAGMKGNVVSETVYAADKPKAVQVPAVGTNGNGNGDGGLNQVSESTAAGGVVTELDAEQGSVTVTLLQDFEVLPLYAAMPPDEQLKVFSPMRPGVRRFILSTNIAETSVTISGMKYVVDTGFVKTRFLTPQTGVEMLKVLPVAKFQANQRAGRAGRESAGKCFRLFTEDAFDKLPQAPLPEIQRTNIAQVLLQLKVLGIASPAAFPFLSPPTDVSLRKALELLLMVEAIGKDQALTPHGKKMASLPLDPVFSHLLLRSEAAGCVAEALTAVSLLSSDNIFLHPHREAEKAAAAQAHRHFASKDGDLPTLLQVYNAWIKANKDRKWASKHFLSHRSLQHVHSVREQLSTLLHKIGVDVKLSCWPEREPFLRCLLGGLFLNVAQRVSTQDAHKKGGHQVSKYEQERQKMAQMQSNMSSMTSSITTAGQGRFHFSNNSDTSMEKAPTGTNIFAKDDNDGAPYRTIRGRQPVHIHPSSVLFSMVSSRKLPEFVVYAELLITSKQYMRNVSVVEGAWLTELFPSHFKPAEGAAAAPK